MIVTVGESGSGFGNCFFFNFLQRVSSAFFLGLVKLRAPIAASWNTAYMYRFALCTAHQAMLWQGLFSGTWRHRVGKLNADVIINVKDHLF